jgi:diadenosine tetraphosphatase ApaH/serine/threonine PP2A family protein phosphatase
VAILGDIVGYGASPNEVTEKARKLGDLFVRGNHDRASTGLSDVNHFNPVAAMAALWTMDELTPENLKWLRELPQGPVTLPELPMVEFVHGSPIDEDEYVIIPRDAAEPLLRATAPVTFFGHTHIQGGFEMQSDQSPGSLRPSYRTSDEYESFTVPLQRGRQYLINPGSVGQPRDGDWRAAFASFDSEAYEVTFYRVPYDVEMAQQRIMDAHLPERLATRLPEGR